MVAAMNLKHIALLVLTTLLSVSQVCAQQYLRIGTGGTAGTYYPVGVGVSSFSVQ
jgi:TRAP-type uncharacterized transport system substrate-binding protein